MLIPILLFLLGLGILILGAESLVRGSSSLAKKWGISPLVIGLTIVAFGTSAPELIVNIFAAIHHTTDIAIGNIVGSNIANILLIVGISALIRPLTVKDSTVWKEIPFAILAIALVFVFGNDLLFDGVDNNVITRTDGIAFMSLFIIFMYYTYGLTKKNEKKEENGIKTYSYSISAMMTLAGLVCLFFGGKLLVDNAVVIAEIFGLSQAFIGLTIVAVGTSLPEMATSIVAAIHKQDDIAIGNIVGSNIFNVFWILGLTSTIFPLSFNSEAGIDVLVATGATVMLFLFLFIGNRQKIDRWQGALFLLSYAGYIVYLVMRG